MHSSTGIYIYCAVTLTELTRTPALTCTTWPLLKYDQNAVALAHLDLVSKLIVKEISVHTSADLSWI